MMQLKRWMWMIAMLAGVLGVVGCVAGLYLVWFTGSRLTQVNERAFGTVDKGLTVTQDRLRGVQQRIKESETKTSEIAQNLKNWSANNVKDRLVSSIEIEKRAENLAGHLQTADGWLQASEETVRGVMNLLELGDLAGARLDGARLEKVLEGFTSIRTKLQEMEQAVSDVKSFSVSREGESEENRFSRVLKLLATTKAGASRIDSRLLDLLGHLSQMQIDSAAAKQRLDNYIVLLTILCYLLLLWIAAGQVALGLYGWKNRRAGSK
jgi:hypothetical protein